MPVNGIGSPSAPRVVGPTAKTEPTAPVAPQAPAQSNGWAAGTNNQRPLDLSLPKHVSSDADIRASMPNPVRAQLEAALNTYTSKIETTLGHDAMSMARGRTPVREGDTLTAAQQTELQNASTDFLKSIPIGALSPELAAGITQKLKDAGLETRDVASTKLGDLGNIGGDIARDLIKDLKAASPTAYYSLAGGLAAAAGVVAWTGGSAKLASLGIKPEVKQKFFDDKLEVKLGGEWDAHFKNFKATGTVTGRVDLGDAGRLSASVTGNSATGFDNARMQYDFNRPNLNLSAYATANRDGMETVGGNLAYRPNDNLSLSAGINHNFQTDRTTATAEAAWKVNKNVDFALSASHDSQGDSRVGAGVRIRF
ncbi:MAG: hypothetical protein Q8L48_05600 [Archangium sp.]|nr:hypothetical protein [Archangium sp.]